MPPFPSALTGPSIEEYRTYVQNSENTGTFASTSSSSTKVVAAPKDFFGHTLSFLPDQSTFNFRAFTSVITSKFSPPSSPPKSPLLENVNVIENDLSSEALVPASHEVTLTQDIDQSHNDTTSLSFASLIQCSLAPKTLEKFISRCLQGADKILHTNARETESFYNSLIEHYGEHIAEYAFPTDERSTAATSHLAGYGQQQVNTLLTTLLNPTLKGMKLNASLAENREEPTGLLQQALRPTIQSAVKELNPSLKDITIDGSFPTEIPTVGLSHQVIKKVLEKADSLVNEHAEYVQEAASAVEKITDSLERLDENDHHIFPIDLQKISQAKIEVLADTMTGLAIDLSHYETSDVTKPSSLKHQLSSLLTQINTDLPKTIDTAHQLVRETRILAETLEELHNSYNYDELGNSSPLKFNQYDFKKFVQPTEELLREVALLGQDVVEHLSSPTSNNKEALLESDFKKYQLTNGAIQKTAQQVAQLKDKLQSELRSLVSKAQTRRDNAHQAIFKPGTLQAWKELTGFSSPETKQEELESAQSHLEELTKLSERVNAAIEEATVNSLPDFFKTVPGNTTMIA